MHTVPMTNAPNIDSTGYVGRIPVKNLWLLMLYASDFFRHQGDSYGDIEGNPDNIPGLIGEILASLVEKRIRRNLTSGYVEEEKVLRRVRGKIDHLKTGRERLLAKGQIACCYENLSVNTPRNRYVRAALYNISSLVEGSALKRRCKGLADSLGMLGVSGIKPPKSEVCSDRFGRHDSSDRMMVLAARLAFDLSMPNQNVGMRRFLAPYDEEKWVRKLFEKAIAGFYATVLDKTWKVYAGKTHQWPIDRQTAGIQKLLQTMKTDIILENCSQNKRIIIDTKFNEILTSGYFRERAFRSGYMYQIYAYLRSQERDDDLLSHNSSGILLHPSVDEDVDESVEIQNHAIRFVTVDLTQPAALIRERLLSIIEEKHHWLEYST